MRTERSPGSFRPFRGPSVTFWVAAAFSLMVVLSGAVAAIPLDPPGSSGPAAAPAPVPISPRSGPVPIPPAHVRSLEIVPPDSVDPTGGYSAEPAPMGIADFGVGHGGVAYSYNTTEFLGNFTWQKLNINGSAGTSFTDQLNVVLKFVQEGVTYAYWVQDVAFMDSSDGQLSFENNIWNFSSGGCLSSSGVSGNGTVTPYMGCIGYYAVSAWSQPGAFEDMPSPGNFQLLVRSYLSTSGLPEVAFEYRDGVTSWYVTYDNVVWPWARAVSSDDNFVVDGTQYNPLGLFYDAELAVGGPGGGSTTAAKNVTHATSQLLFWNGNNFQAPISAWNFGGDTGESISNVQSIWSSDSGGTPRTLQLDGTKRDAVPQQSYDQEDVGFLHLTTPGIASGTVALQNVDWSFVGSQSTLTLNPGAYEVWVNSTSVRDYLGVCTITAGQTLNANTTDGCVALPSVSTPKASVSSDDLGQSVVFTSTLVSPGAGGDTYAWATSPSGLGCTASSTLTLSCTPTSAGNYEVNVSVTDSLGHTESSNALPFEVHTDPRVATPSPSRPTVEVGGSVTFAASATGGVAPYSYSWSGLPTPCTGTTGGSPKCTPSTAGGYTISVHVTDADQYSVYSPTIDYVVATGPAVTTPAAAPAASADLGQSVNFSATATGGSGTYTYHWQGLPDGCTPTNRSVIACRPNATGTDQVSVYVTDTGGGNGTSGTLAYTVYSDPTIAATVSSSKVDEAQSTLFTVNATGGSGTFRYSWSGLPTGCVNSTAPSFSCSPEAAGTFAVRVAATDSDGWIVYQTLNWTVLPDPSVMSFSASPANAVPGAAVSFQVVVQGGLEPYAFNYSGLPPGCAPENRSSLSCTPTATGTFTVTVTVTDSNGMQVITKTTLTVQSELFGLPTAEAYDLILGIVAVGAVVAVLVVVVLRRRKAGAQGRR